jgi:hypothetical protein
MQIMCPADNASMKLMSVWKQGVFLRCIECAEWYWLAVGGTRIERVGIFNPMCTEIGTYNYEKVHDPRIVIIHQLGIPCLLQPIYATDFRDCKVFVPSFLAEFVNKVIFDYPITFFDPLEEKDRTLPYREVYPEWIPRRFLDVVDPVAWSEAVRNAEKEL